MSLQCQFYINEKPNLKRFLHENPYYYKYLNRNSSFVYELEKIMKERYKLRLSDKIDDFKNKLDMLNTFIDILN